MSIDNDIFDLAASMDCQELHFINDKPTGLKGIIAIHNTNLGPTLGGCRWIEYPSTYEAAKDAIRLAQGMTYKSAISGLPLGGGKSVLMKPKGEINKEEYFKAFGRFINNLGGRYITAVDSGTSTAEMDLIATQTKYVANTSKVKYSSSDPSPSTAIGVLRGIESAVLHKFNESDLSKIHVAIQGLGHVGYDLARRLHEKGAKLSVFDINKDIVNKCVDQFDAHAVSSSEELFKLDCDVLSPCALGAALNKDTIPTIKAKIIAGAANNQLGMPTEDAENLLERGILYAPDFVINAGGIIYVAGEKVNHSEEETVAKVDNIYNTLTEIFKRADKENKNTYQVAHDIAIEKVHCD